MTDEPGIENRVDGRAVVSPSLREAADARAIDFGADAVVHGDAAGMHALVGFADPKIRARAERNGVNLLSADSYYASGRSPNEFILGFAAIGERTIAEAVKRLA